jgi:hypothetical protein
LESKKAEVTETLIKLVGVLNGIIGKIEKRDNLEPIEDEEVSHVPFKNLKSIAGFA